MVENPQTHIMPLCSAEFGGIIGPCVEGNINMWNRIFGRHTILRNKECMNVYSTLFVHRMGISLVLKTNDGEDITSYILFNIV